MIDVCLLGTGGMMPLPQRYLTALLVKYDGKGILIDCGEATQCALRKRGWSPKQIDMICFTHYHGDHIAGLPGMLLTMGNAERTEPVVLVGPKGLERVVNALRVIAPELPFPIIYHEIKSDEETTTIEFHNSNITGGFPVAIMLQYGHGTGTGGYVQGRDYINPAIQPIFDKIAEKAWKEVTKK